MDRACCLFSDLLPSRRSECRFPLPYLGEYHLFSREQHTSIHIHSGLLDISDLGEFVCKAKHWELNQYKLMSYYSNGWYVWMVTGVGGGEWARGEYVGTWVLCNRRR